MNSILHATMALLVAPIATADGPPDGAAPKPVPETRADLKQALEDSKRSEPRLPLPPLSVEEAERAEQGGWGVVNNGRMRRHYLPPGFVSGGFPGREEPGMTLGYPFQTTLFWIVSRANNCTYCLGHQESKLASAGVDEDYVAALDGDWSGFTPAERAAFALTRTLTTAPHEVGDAQVEALRPFYDDAQILEILYVVSSFNAMNRWTGALNIPQEHHREYLTPTAPDFASLVSRVAPLSPSAGAGGGAAPWVRPRLESRSEVEERLEAARGRTPRVELVSAEEARARVPGLGEKEPPQWIRLLAHFPGVGAERVAILRAVESEGTLDPLLRARACWVAARNDRAWYALEHARRRLLDLGEDDDRIFALDGSLDGLPEAERLALGFARTLTVDPALVTDAQVEGLREHFTDHQVAELIAVVAEAAFFDRLTEAAGLAPE
ncbi:carboxymuconolactone decarboxylase family protein [Tautonia plasticadhaerens]|uniref:Carboxymuconolactone decarboxylase family protein n=1 Tax=Tautonia plasticadhaerens TaxID=2527974 RepID=A0A518H716_9BACT|nr:carboxymuconolactone decarboxylase family protein [Tautonia plasticadhaerens]QDV36612.1 Carboxymuconolactone decarboxylase family protein [Tautonia plasticadhaerens]